MKEKIVQAAQTLKDNKLQLSDRFQSQLDKLQSPCYGIAIVGRYQVGKSTLVNRVFLRDGLLPEGVGLPKTAVATQIVYGDSKRLLVSKWEKETVNASDLGIEGTSSGSRTINKGTLAAPVITDTPTIADIAAATCADAEEARTKLSAENGEARVEWPCESLRRFTVTDTPGVDDPNQALLVNTTYRILPQADVAVMVVNPGQLSQFETDFLRSRLFEQGMSRIMVMVSYKPDTKKSLESRNAAVENIKAQLALMGRGHIPVVMHCFDNSVEGCLNTPEAIEAAIVRFAEENTEKARMEMAVSACLSDLRAAIAGAKARIDAIGKTEAERAEKIKALKHQENELRDRYNELSMRLQDDLRTELDGHREALSQDLDSIAQKFNERIEAATDTSAVQDLLASAGGTLRMDIERVFFARGKELTARMDRVRREFHAKFDLGGSMDTRVGEFDVDGGILSRIPQAIVTILDYLLVADYFLPGGMIVGAIIRYILGLFPTISKFMPAGIVMGIIKTNAKRCVLQSFGKFKEDVANKIHAALDDVKSKLDSGFDTFMAEELDPIRKAYESTPSTDPAERARLEKSLASLEAIASEIQAA